MSSAIPTIIEQMFEKAKVCGLYSGGCERLASRGVARFCAARRLARCRVPPGDSMKTLSVMTVLGLGIIGLVLWVYFASYPEGPPGTGISKCTSDTSRHGVCRMPDGSIWLVQINGKLVEIQPAHG
jgi:hypothetical protein